MAWAELMHQTGHELLSALAVGLGLDEDHFDEPFANTPAWMGKLVHYVSGDVVPDAGNQGVGLHADYGFITLLLQDSVGGCRCSRTGRKSGLKCHPLPARWW